MVGVSVGWVMPLPDAPLWPRAVQTFLQDDMSLTPVVLIASSGLLNNQGLGPAANLVTALDNYQAVPIVLEYTAVVNLAESLGNTVISDGTLQDLLDLGATTIPSLTNSLPVAVGNTPSGGFTQAVLNQANTIMGNGDLTIFSQIYGACRGYQASANQYIINANSTGPQAATFINMDAITTGGISLVSSDISAFADDLRNLGRAIDPGDIANQGFPSTLLRQLINSGGLLPGVRAALNLNGVTNPDIAAVADSSQPASSQIENRIYQAMLEIKSDVLAQVLLLLDTRTTGLQSMADLLDPKKIFPSSYFDLLLLSGQDILNIYLTDGSVNSAIDRIFEDQQDFLLLSTILPSDQALANRAISQSFFQIKNVLTLNLPDIAAAASALQNNQGLTDINALTTPLPSADIANIESALSPNNSATGAGNTYTLYDFIGTAAGYPYQDQMIIVIDAWGNIDAQNGFVGLDNSSNGAYTVMLNTLNGVYGDPTAGPITGVPAPFNSGDPYANADVAFQTYIPVTESILSSISSTYGIPVSDAGNAWQQMVDQYEREPENWQLALLDIPQLIGNNRPSIMGLINSLTDIGSDDSANGPRDFFSAVANISDPTGQAVIASLREGQNIKALENAGIGTNI